MLLERNDPGSREWLREEVVRLAFDRGVRVEREGWEWLLLVGVGLGVEELLEREEGEVEPVGKVV